MARIFTIDIQNFRGIQEFHQKFHEGINCLIGRGDSGKSTILSAISVVLSSKWSVHFTDDDFYNGNVDDPIIIDATLINLPDKTLSKFGDYVRGISSDGTIIDNFEAESAMDANCALTIRLIVKSDLEPNWYVIDSRDKEPKVISAADRTELNVYSISDLTDRHFSFTKGNPLYSLVKRLVADQDETDSTIQEIMRQAKVNFDDSVKDKFNETLELVVNIANKLGLCISLEDTSAGLDSQDISYNANKVSLHESGVPFRLHGNGSKRILSLAIQLATANPFGVILIDEIEQGLEPDRVQHLVKNLLSLENSQIIITTHSSNVVTELSCDNLFIMRNHAVKFESIDSDYQGCVRKNPEAFFAKKVLVCEGATEVGIMRSINSYLITQNKASAAVQGVRFADGTGRSMINYVNGFVRMGYECALFCDSDDDTVNSHKLALRDNGVVIADCEKGKCIEQQLFCDLPWDQVIDCVNLRIDNAGVEMLDVYNDVTYNMQDDKPNFDNWLTKDLKSLRAVLGTRACNKSWFKDQDRGSEIGDIMMSCYESLPSGNHIKSMIDSLIHWIEA